MVFFRLTSGLVLAPYPAEALTKDAGITTTQARLSAVSSGHLVANRAEVDRIMTQASGAGAVITDPARERFWAGYSGYVHDPDDHLWEIAHNRDWTAATQDQ